MKTIAIEAYGDVSRLKEIALPRPVPQRHHVVVELHYASVNPVDWKIRSGQMRSVLTYEFPLVLGLDLAGVVTELGPDVTRFKVGDAVLAKTNIAQNGAYAEFASVDERLLVRKPESLDFAAAAALPLAGITAWQALTDHSKLKSGETVLVHGGAGGVGSLAIAFAKSLGATVVTTTSEKNTAFVRGIGADRAIAYDREDFVAVLGRSVDVVFDMIGGDVLARSYDVLRPGGRLVTIWGEPDAARAIAHAVTAVSFVTAEGGPHLAQIVALAEAGRVRPVVGSSYPFSAEGLQQAHRQSETGHGRGKIVIRLK